MKFDKAMRPDGNKDEDCQKLKSSNSGRQSMDTATNAGKIISMIYLRVKEELKVKAESY